MSSTSEVHPITQPEGSGTPLFPLSTVLFPGGPLPLRIFEPRYVDMVRDCMRAGCPFGVVLIRTGYEVGASGVGDTCRIGTTARIVDFNSLPDGLLGITCTGERKFTIAKHWQQEDGLHRAEIEYAPDEELARLPAEFQHLSDLLRNVWHELGDLYARIPENFTDASWVGFRLAETLPISLAEKQYCLELNDPLARLSRLSPLIRKVSE